MKGFELNENEGTMEKIESETTLLKDLGAELLIISKKNKTSTNIDPSLNKKCPNFPKLVEYKDLLLEIHF